MPGEGHFTVHLKYFMGKAFRTNALFGWKYFSRHVLIYFRYMVPQRWQSLSPSCTW